MDHLTDNIISNHTSYTITKHTHKANNNVTNNERGKEAAGFRCDVRICQVQLKLLDYRHLPVKRASDLEISAKIDVELREDENIARRIA